MKIITKTILLVEDEETLRDFIAEVLRMFGYVVIEADCAARARAIWEKQITPIDLLLTDVDLPGLTNGVELARELQAEAADLKVVLTTGHDAYRIMEEYRLDKEETDFLQKPFQIEDLTSLVQRSFANEKRNVVNVSFSDRGLRHDHLKAALA